MRTDWPRYRPPWEEQRSTGSGRRAQDLPDLIEAAALAHDLGHPPFGHNGEEALGRMMQLHARGMFEGNAQSFRIVTNLEPKVYQGGRSCGLDLTRATLNAILKYPIGEAQAWSKGEKKFCIYDDQEDEAVVTWIFEGEPPTRTIATDMLEAADDIAYAAHDFEDGVWSTMIPLYRLIEGDEQPIGRLQSRVDVAVPGLFEPAGAKEELVGFVDDYDLRSQPWACRPFDRSRAARASLKGLTARMIGDLIGAITPDDKFTTLSDEVRRRLELLKAMAWIWMIEDPVEESVRYGQRRLVEALFEAFWENPKMLPHREAWQETAQAGPSSHDRHLSHADATTDPAELVIWRHKARLICDHVAGMTDLYAMHVHDEMFRGGGAGLLRRV